MSALTPERLAALRAMARDAAGMNYLYIAPYELSALLDALEQRVDLTQLAAALVAKLDLIAPILTGQAAYLYVHGQRYDGPNYAEELSALRAALNSVAGRVAAPNPEEKA